MASLHLPLSSIQPSYSGSLGAADAHRVALSVVGGIEDDGAVLHICESGDAATKRLLRQIEPVPFLTHCCAIPVAPTLRAQRPFQAL